MVSILFRDSLMGRIIYHLSGRKALRRPEEQPDYVVPQRYLSSACSSAPITPARSVSADEEEDEKKEENTYAVTTVAEISSQDQQTRPYVVVTWDGGDDPENPKNWPWRLKIPFMLMVSVLTASIYMGAAIYTPGYEEIMETYDCSQVVAVLPMSLYVLGYGIGPMLWSPLSEHPPVGKLYIYLGTLSLFTILQIPTALAKDLSLAALLVLRFLGGFLASPVLSTGGASFGDVLPISRLPIGLAAWGIGALLAPMLGPLFGAIFTVKMSVFWSFWLLMIMCGATLIVLIMFFPETSQSTLLYEKAKRLRKVTGNDRIVSEAELSMHGQSVRDVIVDVVCRPFVITTIEPIVLAINLYVALTYAIYYTFFEAFPLVFSGVYNFTLVEQGCAYFAVAFGTISGCFTYMFIIWRKYTVPKERGDPVTPEVFLPPAIYGSLFLPLGLMLFAWSANVHVHWIVPMIGSAFFTYGAFFIYQTLFNYMGFSFPRYMASVFASNSMFRATSGAAFPLFANIMYTSLGPKNFPVGWGCTILGLATTAMVGIPITFCKYGVQLRGRSKYAN